jgi:hypothetical protein
MEKLKQIVHYWKIDSDDMEEDDPKGVLINETNDERVVQGKASSSIAPYYGLPLKTKKHNIGTKEAPKMVIIGDY